MQGGIERRNIFKDNTDRNRFLERLGSVLQKTSTPCYGWALIRDLGLTATEVGKYFGLSKSAVSRAATRGQKLIVDQFLPLKD